MFFIGKVTAEVGTMICSCWALFPQTAFWGKNNWFSEAAESQPMPGANSRPGLNGCNSHSNQLKLCQTAPGLTQLLQLSSSDCSQPVTVMSTCSQDFGIGVRRGRLRTCWSIAEPYVGQIWNQSPIYQLPGMWKSGAFGDTYLCFQKWKHRELLIDESKSIPGTVWGVIIWQHFTVPTAGNVIMWVVIVHPPIAAAQARPHSGARSVSTKGTAMF